MKRITFKLFTILQLIFCISACRKESNTNLDNKPVQNYAGISLSNQSSASFNCFLTFDSCKVHTLSSAKANEEIIDLIFLHNNPDNLAMLVSPASLEAATTFKPDIFLSSPNGVTNWSAKNTIQIGITDITLADFNNIRTNGDLHNAYENDNHVTIGWEIDITPNKVYKFTSGRTGKRGLIKVNSMSGNYTTAGQINFDIKLIN